MSPLKSMRARANRWRCAIATIHALRIAQRCFTVLSHVSLWTLADLVEVAHPAIRTLLVTLRIRSFD